MRKFASLLGVLAVATLLGACGNADERVTTGTYAGEGGAPAPFLDLGPLAYQVQISRQLNPAESEDAAYLAGLTPAQAKLQPGEEWFAVFIQVYNRTSHPHRATTNMSLSDTQGNVYAPVLPVGNNLFVFRGGYVPAHGQIPEASTIAAESPTQGAVLLFKIKLASLSNRPIELKIVSATNPAETASAELDV
jgi:hypothetical protein